jgi:catechol-2,3-dioxygenase
MFHVTDPDHIALTVRDRERSPEWYQRVLGMERRYQEVWSEQNILFSFEDHTIPHSIYLFDPDGQRIELTTYELT